MDRKRKLAILFAAVAVAVASGNVMQQGRGTAAPTGAAAMAAGPVAASRAPQVEVPEMPAAAAEVPMAVAAAHPVALPPAAPLPAAPPPAAPLPVAPLPAAPQPLPLPDVEDAAAPVLPGAEPGASRGAASVAADACAPTLELAPAPSAMVDLHLSAPCAPEARIVVRHAGLALTGRTGRDGRFLLSIPALEETAEVAVMLPGGETLARRIAVPGLAAWDRVAVQWQPPDAFALHGFEDGAEFGAPGHLSAAATQGAHGFLTVLGDDSVERPMLAEVLTLRRGALDDGAVRVRVEAPLLASTCGRELLADLIEARAGRTAVLTELTVVAPDCTEVGDFAVLPWILAEDRVAGN